MKKENLEWTKNTDVTDKDLVCKCGKEVDIIHCSNWHDNTGVFYVQCECGRQFNVRWHHKKEMYECPACKRYYHKEEFDGGTCKTCADGGWWVDPAGGLHFDDPNSEEFEDPAAMYE
jgi:hypothetical protein